MTPSEVKELMKGSGSEQQWSANCDKVKKTCGGYPPFWYAEIVQSGFMHTVQQAWKIKEVIGNSQPQN